MTRESGAASSTTATTIFRAQRARSSSASIVSSTDRADAISHNTEASLTNDFSTEEALKYSASGEDMLKGKDFKSGSINPTPLAGAASMAVRREFHGAAFNTTGAYDAYKGMIADDFAGPDDIRLQQLNNLVVKKNKVLYKSLNELSDTNVEVSGRSKSVISIFGKIREKPDFKIGDIKDLSGIRLDIAPTQPQFVDITNAESKVKNLLGEGLALKQNYIENPNSWGYTGRIHHILAEPKGFSHEVQIGAKDLSLFLDQKLTTASGQKISLHDSVLYKGQYYGVNLPKVLDDQISQQMRDITAVHGSGRQLADDPVIQKSVNKYVDAVEKALPATISKPKPKLSSRAIVGNSVTKGFAVLGVVGGTVQTINGANRLANGGNKIEGVADLAAGTAGITSGAALVVGRVALGTGTGGAVAVLDGARDIYTGVRDGDMRKTAVGSIKAGAGTAMIAGVVAANPILIAGGAIAYGGALVYESRDAIISAAKSAWNRIRTP